MNSPSSEVQHNATPNTSNLPRKLAKLAVLLWCISLALPVFVAMGNRDSCYGIGVLLLGWMGPIALNFGWFANAFSGIALIYSEQRRPAVSLAFVAVVLSLNTFTWGHTCDGDGPRMYGLGLGAVLWLIAIALVFVVVAIRDRDLGRKSNYVLISKCYLLGLIAVIISLAIYDRVVGNEDELYKLNHRLVAFKHSQVCSLSPKPANRIVLNGSIELISSKTNYLISPETLLNLGVPFVRKEGRDYFLVEINNTKTVESKPAISAVSAILTIDDIRNTYSEGNPTFTPKYKVSLVSSEGVVGFEQI